MKINPEDQHPYHLSPESLPAAPPSAPVFENAQANSDNSPPLRDEVQQLYECMLPGHRVRRRDVIHIFDRGDRVKPTVLAGRYTQARIELITHPEIGPRIRTDGAKNTTVYWLVENEADDLEFRIPLESVKKLPEVRKPGGLKGSPTLPSSTPIFAEEKFPPLDDGPICAQRLVGVYSVYLYNKLGFEGVGVFDYLMHDVNSFHTIQDIAQTLYLNDSTSTKVVTEAVKQLSKDKYIKPYLDTTTYGGSIGSRKPIALRSSVDTALFGDLDENELQLLRNLDTHRQGVAVADLVRGAAGPGLRSQVDGHAVAARSLYRISRKYPHHILFSDQEIGKTLVQFVHLKRYRQLTQV